MANPLLMYLLEGLQRRLEETPKPRQHRRGGSFVFQHAKKHQQIERQLKRAKLTYGRTQKPHDLARVQRLERALLSVNGVKE